MTRLGSLITRQRGTRQRTVPSAVLPHHELIHLGGGENVPCPGLGDVPVAASSRHLGLGSTSLALPPARVHVLREVTICPGARVVMDRRGRIVAESLTTDMVGRVPLDEHDSRTRPIQMGGIAAIYRSPWRPHFHVLVDHLPRAALLGQPAMRRVGQLSLLHDGPLSRIEAYLLPRLLGRQVDLVEVDPSRRIDAERTVLPGYVTRPGAGAIPSWYRRWIDREAAQVSGSGSDGPRRRRIFVDRTRGARQVLNRDDLDQVLRTHRIETVDPAALTAVEEIALFRDAELVLGVTGSGLANTIFCRSAHLVELVPGRDLLPNYYYLATSKGLPYDYVLEPHDDRHLSAEERLQHDVHVDVATLDRLLTRLR